MSVPAPRQKELRVALQLCPLVCLLRTPYNARQTISLSLSLSLLSPPPAPPQKREKERRYLRASVLARCANPGRWTTCPDRVRISGAPEEKLNGSSGRIVDISHERAEDAKYEVSSTSRRRRGGHGTGLGDDPFFLGGGGRKGFLGVGDNRQV